MNKLSLIVAALSCVALSSAAVFDFESDSIGAYTSGTSFSNGGVTMSVYSSGGYFHVTDSVLATNLGTQSIFANNNPNGPFAQTGTYFFNAIDFRFDQDIASATLLAGDGGGDNDAYVVVDLYDSADAYLGQYKQWLFTSGDGLTFDIGITFRRAVVSTTGTQLPNSVAAEFSQVNAVPEPASLTILGLGALAALRRRKRS